MRATDDPVAMVASLGRPPLPGHEMAAERILRSDLRQGCRVAIALAAAVTVSSNAEDDDDSSSYDGQDATR